LENFYSTLGTPKKPKQTWNCLTHKKRRIMELKKNYKVINEAAEQATKVSTVSS